MKQYKYKAGRGFGPDKTIFTECYRDDDGVLLMRDVSFREKGYWLLKDVETYLEEFTPPVVVETYANVYEEGYSTTMRGSKGSCICGASSSPAPLGIVKFTTTDGKLTKVEIVE